MLIFWRLAIVWSVLWFVASAGAQVYKAELATAEWEPVSDKSRCSITHTIPGFGSAVLIHSPGNGVAFNLESQQIVFPAGEVNIETLPPKLRADVASVKIGKVISVAGSQSIKMESAQISLVLAQLNNGISVAFISQPKIINNKLPMPESGARAVRVILEAKNFASAYKIYQQCTGEYSASAAENSGQNNDVTRMLGYVKRDANTYGSSINKGSQTETAKMMEYIERDASIYGETIKNTNKEQGKNSGLAKAPIFAADIMSADWKSTSNPFVCSITHIIPGFGKANLLHKAGSEEVFFIESLGEIIFPAGPTNIESLPPVWRNTVMPLNIGTITAVAGLQPITLKENNIAQVISQLSSGVKVMFTPEMSNKKHINPYIIDAGIIRVVLETRNFLPAYKRYQQCISELINYTFLQVARTLIHYPENPEGLSVATKIELAKVARYMKADQKVLGILIDAHSDNSEATKINEAISKQYAEWVSVYLVAQGIAANKIASRWHGEKFPIASNATAKGRAQNRRVTVRLETKDTREENEKNAAARKAALEAEKLNPKKGKLTPEEIDKIVEGLDLIPQQ